MKKKILSQLIITGLFTATMTTGFAQEVPSQDMDTAAEILSEDVIDTDGKKQMEQQKDKTDKEEVITFKGLSRYDIRRDNRPGQKGETRKSLWRNRLEPTVNLDGGWKIKSRMDFEKNYKAKGDDKSHFYNRMLYLQGPALGGTISAGKVDYADFANMDIAYGMIFDDYVKGVRYNYTDKNSGTIYTAMIGNFDSPYNDSVNGKMYYDKEQLYPERDALHYAGFQAEFPVSDRLMAGVAYHNVRSGELEDTQQILEVAGEYKLDKNFKLGGVYAISNLDADKYDKGNSEQEQAYVLQLNYKGAKRAVPNTYGLWAAYKNIGELATFLPTYTNTFVGEQGYEIGGRYVIAKNLTGEVSYFNGNDIESDKKKTRWFGRLEYRF